MRNLFKAMMLLVILLVLVSPILAQSDSPDSPVTVVESADGETTVIVTEGVESDDFGIIGMVVVAVISITVIMVNGATTGKYFEAFEKSARYLIDNKPLGDGIEQRVSQWSPDKRRYFNAIYNVFDSHTDFDWTDLDDDVKAWYRDKFDGVVEPVLDAVADS